MAEPTKFLTPLELEAKQREDKVREMIAESLAACQGHKPWGWEQHNKLTDLLWELADGEAPKMNTLKDLLEEARTAADNAEMAAGEAQSASRDAYRLCQDLSRRMEAVLPPALQKAS